MVRSERKDAWKSLRGFTLLELLVVIAIIGMLASVVFASLGDARDNANSVKSKTDLKAFRIAMELYRNANGETPPGPFTNLPTAAYSHAIAPACNQLPGEPWCWDTFLSPYLKGAVVPVHNGEVVPNCRGGAFCDDTVEKIQYIYAKKCVGCSLTFENNYDTEIILAPIKNQRNAPFCTDQAGQLINGPRRMGNAFNCQDINVGCVLDGGYSTDYAWICIRF